MDHSHTPGSDKDKFKLKNLMKPMSLHRSPKGPTHHKVDHNLIFRSEGTFNSMSSADVAPQNPLAYEQYNDWLTGDYYLCITIREARRLAVQDADTKSSDPFVRVIFGESTATPTEDSTRVCYRNTEPLWEESMLFPIQGKSPDTMVKIAVYDKDVMKIRFMGQVVLTLGYLLSQIREVDDEVVHWYALGTRKSTDIVSGDICFAVSVLDKATYVQLYHDKTLLLDPVSLNNRLGGMNLQLALHDIKPLLLNTERYGPLSLEVRIGRSTVSKPIIVKDAPKSDGLLPGFKVSSLDDVILIPLSKAFLRKGITLQGAVEDRTPQAAFARGFQGIMNGMVEGGMVIGAPQKRNKEKAELADIKIYMKAGKELIAKTQIPIWTVPTKSDSPPPPPVTPPPSVMGDEPASTAPVTPGGHLIESRSPLKRLWSNIYHHLDDGDAQQGQSHPIPDVQPSLASSLTTAVSVPALNVGPEGNAGFQLTPMGRRYTRVMESYRKDLAPSLELSVSLQLKKKEEQGPAAAETVEDSEEEEDISAPPVYNPPPDLDTAIAEGTVACGPNKLYRLLWKPDSDVIKKLNEAEKLKDLVITPWVVDPVTKTKSRTQTYVKPLNLKIPFVPKEAPCSNIVTVLGKEDGGWCVSQKIQTKAPQGDTFYVMMQWVAVHVSANKSKLKVTQHIEFVKNVMTKGIIINQSQQDARKYLQLTLRTLRESVGDAAGDPEEATSTAVLAQPQAEVEDTSFMGLPMSLVQLLQLVLLTFVFLMLWRISGTVRRSSDKLVQAVDRLAEVVRASSSVSGIAPNFNEVLREALLQSGGNGEGQAVTTAPHGEL